MRFWRRCGPEGAKLSRAGMKTSSLCRNSGNYSGRPRGVALTYWMSCRSVVYRMVSVLVSTCIKYVSYPTIGFVLYFHALFPTAPEIALFQVFQLTSLVIRGPACRGERFFFSLDPVTIKNEKVRVVLLFAQVFVRSPQFTQRSFSDSGLTMLFESVAIADSIASSPVFVPWSIVETACVGHVINDLRACWDRVVLQRRTAEDTSEPWYHGGTPRSETASIPGVRISDVVEEGRAEYVLVASPAVGPPGPSKLCSSPSKRKRKISWSPMKLPQKFEISSPSASPQKRSFVKDTKFASTFGPQASRGKSRRSGRDQRASPAFQMVFP